MQIMQPGRLQESGAVGRGDAQGDRLLVALDLQYHLAAGLAAGPDAAPERGEARHRVVTHREDAIARFQPALDRRAPLRHAGDDNRVLVLDLGGVEPEPRARRTVRPAT